VPCQSQPECQIYVLDITEVVLVKSADVVEDAAPIKCGGRTGRKNFLLYRIPDVCSVAMALAPDQTTDMICISRAVKKVGAICDQHTTAEKGKLRLGLSSAK